MTYVCSDHRRLICADYRTFDYYYLLKLKLFLVLQVLAQMLRCGLTKYEAHGPAEADQAEFPEKEIFTIGLELVKALSLHHLISDFAPGK
jgi:hypothetical protein